MELLHIDTFQIARRFAQAGQSYDEHAIIQKKIAHRLMQLMTEHAIVHQSADQKIVQSSVENSVQSSAEKSAPNIDGTHDQNHVFEIGCGSGNLTKRFIEYHSFHTLYLNDLYPEVKQHFKADRFAYKQAHAEQFKDQPFKDHKIKDEKITDQEIKAHTIHAPITYDGKAPDHITGHHGFIEWRMGNAETIEFPPQLNLIISSSALQWMQDLEGLFKKCNQALLHHGFLCFSTFGKSNLREIKALTQQGLAYYQLAEIQQQLEQQGFEVLHISEQVSTLTFKHPKHVLQHLKATGVTATAAKFRWTKQSLANFYQGYRQFISTDEHENLVYPLSYHPIYVIARKQAQ